MPEGVSFFIHLTSPRSLRAKFAYRKKTVALRGSGKHFTFARRNLLAKFSFSSRFRGRFPSPPGVFSSTLLGPGADSGMSEGPIR